MLLIEQSRVSLVKKRQQVKEGEKRKGRNKGRTKGGRNHRARTKSRPRSNSRRRGGRDLYEMTFSIIKYGKK